MVQLEGTIGLEGGKPSCFGKKEQLNRNMTKKNLFLTIAVIALLGTGYIGYFYYKNLRGIGPVVNPPPIDITKTENTTGLPLKLPAGFGISIYAKDLSGPRVMAHAPSGNLIVAEMAANRVVELIDTNNDGKANKTAVVIAGLNKPHGIAFLCPQIDAEKTKFNGKPLYECKIYIAETDKVVEYDYDKENMKALNGKKIIDLPGPGGHSTRTLLFMPYPNENILLIAVGSSCNVCHESDNRRAKVLQYDTRTGKVSEFARGLRNTVFMEIHPVTGEIWGTDMGRDLLGDDIPPDEINIIREGKNYGWPICYGKNIHDDEFDKNTYIRNPCMEPFETESHIDLQAHSAPLGLAFFPEEGWPEEYWHNLLVAYHGSWNRSAPTGYKIVRFKMDPKGKVLGGLPGQGPEDFISGWLTNDGALGRPVDIIIQPGGTIYISDDKAGIIYKVNYNGAR